MSQKPTPTQSALFLTIAVLIVLSSPLAHVLTRQRDLFKWQMFAGLGHFCIADVWDAQTGISQTAALNASLRSPLWHNQNQMWRGFKRLCQTSPQSLAARYRCTDQRGWSSTDVRVDDVCKAAELR